MLCGSFFKTVIIWYTFISIMGKKNKQLPLYQMFTELRIQQNLACVFLPWSHFCYLFYVSRGSSNFPIAA